MLFESVYTKKGRCYIRYNDGTSKRIETPYKSEYFIPDSLGEYRGFLDNKPLRKIKGYPEQRNKAYGITSQEYVAIREKYNKYNKTPRTWHLDIETEVQGEFPKPEDANERIVLIQFWDTTDNKGYVLGLEDWYRKNDYEYNFDVEYTNCKTEKNLMDTFLELFKRLDPLIITAWNGSNFDYPYMYNRFKKFNKANFSNYGKTKLVTKKLDNGQITNSLKSDGHYFIDLLDVYKKFVYKNVPNYSLDTIAEIELGINKVQHNNYLKFDDFRTGKYVILGDETEEEKKTLIYRCAETLQTETNEIKIKKLKSYIKEKSYSEFVHYGIQDFVLLKGINEAQNLVPIMIQIAEKMGCTIQDVLGTLKPWNIYIGNVAYKNKKIMPPKIEHDDPDIVGGYVREPIAGKHNWILSSDVSSMYPLLSIAACNMSPETFIPKDQRPKELQQMIDKYFPNQDETIYLKYTEEWDHIVNILKKYNVSLGINGSVYKRDQDGLIPLLVTDIYNTRKLKKKEMFKHKQNKVNILNELEKNKSEALIKELQKETHLEAMMDTAQMTEKILINSLYGAIGNKHFVLFNEDIAAAITGNGRYFIRYIADYVQKGLEKLIPNNNYILAGDTDSFYFTLEPFVNKYCKKSTIETVDWLDKFYNKIVNKMIQDVIQLFSTRLNLYKPEFIGMDREVISDRGFFVAKKKYALRVLDNEGTRYTTQDPYIKIQGLETIQGGVAPFSKKYLKQSIPMILDKTEQQIKDWVKSLREEFQKTDLTNIAKTIGISRIYNPEWGTIKDNRIVSIPSNSKAAIATNNWLKQHNKQEEYPMIEAGDKAMLLYLKEPNQLKNDRFAFLNNKFAELFRDEIDYDLNWEKSFLKPLKNMTDPMGYRIDNKIQQLDDW
jgi:DNA polymerase elongation subunit (family B)